MPYKNLTGMTTSCRKQEHQIVNIHGMIYCLDCEVCLGQ